MAIASWRSSPGNYGLVTNVTDWPGLVGIRPKLEGTMELPLELAANLLRGYTSKYS
jgi:hypothetical protein